MIQYTGTSSRSNYNDERTATIGRPSELLRRLGVGSRPVLYHLPSSLSLAPPHHRVDFLLLSLLFLDPLCFTLFFLTLLFSFFIFFSSSSSSSYTSIQPPVATVHSTATRANISSGSSRGHGVTVDESLLLLSRSSGIITGATARVHLTGSASSAEYVLDETILQTNL